MPLYLNEEQAVTFFHIPKTAGTTIESWLEDSGKYQQLLFSQYKLEDILVTPQHLGYETVSKLTNGVKRPFSYKFAIVRNPFDRLVSEFFYRIKLGSISLGENPELLFSSWLIHNLTKYKKKPEVLDNHLRPQTYYVNHDVEVFKFEDGIQNVLDIVGAKLGIKSDIEVKSKKVGEKKSIYWTDAAINMVLDIYSEDFEIFNYSTDTSHFDIESAKYTNFKNNLTYISVLTKNKIVRKIK
jgi:hypothetical protein